MYWSAGIQTAIALITAWLMPKRLTRLEIYATWSVVIALTLSADILGALTFHLYDVATPKSDWQAWLINVLFPPAIAVIFLNYMPRKRRSFVVYLVVVVVPISVFLEWLDIFFGYFTYRHWSLWFSAGIYLLGMIYLRWHLHFVRAEVDHRTI